MKSLSIIAAVGIGLLTATQPLSVTLAFIAGVTLVMLSLITPIASLAMLLILAPMRTLIATEASIQLPIDIGQISFVMLIGFWGVQRISQHKSLLEFKRSALYAPLIGYVFFLAISAFEAASITAWITEWLKWILILILVILVLNFRQYWEWIVFTLITAGTGAAIIGLYTFFGGSGADHLVINGRFFRAFGTFGQPNPLGGFMGLLAPISLMMTLGYGWMMLRYRRLNYMPHVVFYGFASLLIIATLFASWSRGAWLGFGVSMMVIAFALPRRMWQSLVLIILLLGFGGIAWSSGKLPVSITDRIGSATQELFVLNDVRAVDITPENYPIVERLAHWQAALKMAQDNPWLGVGIGNYDVAYEDYRLINWKESLGHAHNYYLNVLAETGIIGAAAYAAVFMIVIWIAWRTRAHPDFIARCFAIGFLGMCAYLLTHSLTDNLYVNNIFIHLGVIFGVLAVLHHDLEVTTT